MLTDNMRCVRCIVSFAALLLLGGCAKINMDLPAALPEPERHHADAGHSEVVVAVGKQAKTLQMESLPALDVASWKADGDQRWGQFDLPSGKLSLRADAIPLNEFIHMALGDTLKLSFIVDKDVASRTDPVTLHISQPVKAERLLG